MIGITGSSGMVGSALMAYLRAQGIACRPILRADYSSAEAFSGCSAIIHLAALAHRTGPAAHEHDEINHRLPVACAHLAAQAGVRRFVFVSSSKALCNWAEDTLPLPEDAPCRPTDPYGRAKCDAEQALLHLHQTGHIEVSIARPALIIGHPAKANILRLARAARSPWSGAWGFFFRGFQSPRSYTGLGNICSALHLLATHPAASGQIFHVVEAQPLSLAQLFDSLVQPDRPSVPGGDTAFRRARWTSRLCQAYLPRIARPFVLDGSKIGRILGWQPQIPLRTEIQNLMDKLPKADEG